MAIGTLKMLAIDATTVKMKTRFSWFGMVKLILV
jgi:hypothetical protein